MSGQLKTGNADKSSYPAMMNVLHNMKPSSSFLPKPSSDLQTELQDNKVPTNGCSVCGADINVLFTQSSLHRDDCLGVKERLINQSTTDLKD